MIRLDCAGRATAISLLATIVVLFGAQAADARKVHHHHRARADAVKTVPAPGLPESEIIDPALKNSGVMLSGPSYAIVDEDSETPPATPVIVKPVRRIYCAEYARIASGIAIFGDARTWWEKARNNYAQTDSPSPGAVMVFNTRKQMRSGHVAVVKRVVSERE